MADQSFLSNALYICAGFLDSVVNRNYTKRSKPEIENKYRSTLFCKWRAFEMDPRKIYMKRIIDEFI